MPSYFRSVFALLEPGGLFLNHGIIESPEQRRVASLTSRMLWGKGDFMGQLVFPRGELVRLDEEIANGEESGFKTRDVESLREHYVLTLRRWVRRLEEHRAEAIRIVGRQTYSHLASLSRGLRARVRERPAEPRTGAVRETGRAGPRARAAHARRHCYRDSEAPLVIAR